MAQQGARGLHRSHARGAGRPPWGLRPRDITPTWQPPGALPHDMAPGAERRANDAARAAARGAMNEAERTHAEAQRRFNQQRLVYNYKSLVYEPARQVLREQMRDVHRSYMRSAVDWMMDDTMGRRVLSQGDEIVAGINRTLDMFKMKRAAHQIEFHDQFTRSCLPKIYPDWDTNYDAILKRYNLSQIHMESLIVCPRRFGKTIAVSMYVAAYIMNVPNSEVSIFSTGRRTAGKLMQSVIKFLQELPGFEDRIKTKNFETLVLDFGNGDTRTMSSYPGTVAVCPTHTFSFLCHFAILPFCHLLAFCYRWPLHWATRGG